MSSYTEYTTYVDDKEWARINDIIHNADAYCNRNAAIINEINSNIQAIMNQSAIEHKERIEVASTALRGLKDAFQDALSSTTGLMEEQTDMMVSAFNSDIDRLRNHVSGIGYVIEDVENQFIQLSHHINQTNIHAGVIADSLNHLQGVIGILNNNLHGINARANDVASSFNQAFQSHLDSISATGDKANALIEALDALLSRINELKPEVFAPERYRTLVSVRELAGASMSAGDYTAALACSQNSIIDASALLARLVVENEDFSNALYSARQGVALIGRRISSYEAEGVLRDAKGEYDYDIRHWSNGRFEEIVNNFQRISRELDNPNLNFEQLQTITQHLEIIDNNLSICDTNARAARFAGVAVQEVATRIFNRLGESNWELAEHGYIEEDDRNAFSMVYSNGSGDSIAMVIAPDNPEKPAFMIEAFSEDEFRRVAIKDGINAELREDGAQISGQVVNNDCHMNTDAQTFIQRVGNQ